ncbi:MAG: DegV family protein [Candidatus Heimdallarchaeota archaeon]|nr:DegV family protein [Candidatus Heimdallarchaeota archaeon]
MSNSFAIVTDSGADFSPEYQKEIDLFLIPTRIMLGEVEYIDRENVTRDEIIKALTTSKVKVSTSVASQPDFHKILTEALEKYGKVIFICISSVLSGSFQQGILTSRKIDRENIVCIDTKSVSYGMTLLIEHASLRRKQGIPFEKVVEELKLMSSSLQIYFTAETLEFLIRGGRIGRAKGILGKLLGLKPVLAINGSEGVIYPFGTAKSAEEGWKMMYDDLKKYAKEYKHFHLVAIYGIENQDFKDFALKIEGELNPTKFTYGEIGANIICHVGPYLQCLGIVKIPEETLESYK